MISELKAKPRIDFLTCLDPIGPRLANGAFYSDQAIRMLYEEIDRKFRFAKKEDFREGLYNKTKGYLKF